MTHKSIFEIHDLAVFKEYRESPDSKVFVPPQETLLLSIPYCLGIDLVLKLRFMTFGFSKSPFIAHFQAISIFETKK